MSSQIPNFKCTVFFDGYREVSKQNFDSVIVLITRKHQTPIAYYSLFWSSSKDIPSLKAIAATDKFMVASAGTDSGFSLS